jgi:hypothetical protein
MARLTRHPPRPPDWDSTTRGPAGKRSISPTVENVRATRSHALTKPMVLGPTSRTPPCRAAARIRASTAFPASPASPKPAPRTIANGIPARPQAVTASGTCAAGSPIQATSTPAGSVPGSG